MRCRAAPLRTVDAFKFAVLNAGYISSWHFNRNAKSFYVASRSSELTVRSIRLRTSRPPKGEGRHGWRPAQSRACLISAYPFFASREFTLLPVQSKQKNFRRQRARAKISPRGPFRGNRAQIRGFLFFGREISGIKKESALWRREPTLITSWNVVKNHWPRALQVPLCRNINWRVFICSLIDWSFTFHICGCTKNFRSWKFRGDDEKLVYTSTNLRIVKK